MTKLDLSGKVAVITGASRGLGAGLAEAFAERGIKLGLCARGRPVLPDGDAVVAQQFDIVDEQAVMEFSETVVKRLGPIDLWINNAGVLDPVRFLRELTGDELMQHLAVNVSGVLHGSRAFVLHRRAHGGKGVLINISSGAALKGYAGWSAYCAGKAAVDRLTECVQLEEAALGLRAYAVAPGVIDTAMQHAIRGMSEAQFPMVRKFQTLKQKEAFNSTGFVARHLLTIAFGPAEPPSEVVLRLPAEQAMS